MDVTPIRPQVEDGITDELAGTVISHISASRYVVHGDPQTSEFSPRDQQVLWVSSPARPYGDPRRVLEQ